MRTARLQQIAQQVHEEALGEAHDAVDVACRCRTTSSEMQSGNMWAANTSLCAHTVHVGDARLDERVLYHQATRAVKHSTLRYELVDCLVWDLLKAYLHARPHVMLRRRPACRLHCHWMSAFRRTSHLSAPSAVRPVSRSVHRTEPTVVAGECA